MSDLALALGLALPVLAGWGLTRLLGLAPPPGASPFAVAGRAAVAALVGVGLSSLTPFVWLLAGGALGRAFAIVDGIAFGLAALWLGLRPPRAPTRGGSVDGAVAPREPLDRVAVAATLLAIGVALGVSVAVGAAAPHGEMDAWMMWNMRARFLLRAGEAWRIGFAPELGWTSTEYPLLLPLSIARLWAYAGETQLAPAALASLFTVATPVALAAAVAARAGAWQGALAALLLVASPGFLSLGASQYADVPVAAYLVAALLALDAAGEARAGGRIVAGFLLGCAGWTKNEGVLAAAIVVAVAAGSDLARGAGVAARRLMLLLAGAAAPAAAWIAFHQLVMPRITGVLFRGHTAGTVLQRLTDGARWRAVLSALAERAPGAHVGFPLVVLALAALVAWRARALPRSRALPVALLALAAHAVTFMLTTWDLAWHLRLAADRVILQAWPIVLLALLGGRSEPTPVDAA